jgi:hypothetical protein
MERDYFTRTPCHRIERASVSVLGKRGESDCISCPGDRKIHAFSDLEIHEPNSLFEFVIQY